MRLEQVIFIVILLKITGLTNASSNSIRHADTIMTDHLSSSSKRRLIFPIAGLLIASLGIAYAVSDFYVTNQQKQESAAEKALIQEQVAASIEDMAVLKAQMAELEAKKQGLIDTEQNNLVQLESLYEQANSYQENLVGNEGSVSSLPSSTPSGAESL